MRASGHVLGCVLAVAVICLSSLAAAQQSDEVMAAHILGPRWKQLSRRAGMIFAGTVLAAAPPRQRPIGRVPARRRPSS
jgi:hypothetical protein